MTNNERELVAALEPDVEMWESLAEYVEHPVKEINLSDESKISGTDYPHGVRERIIKHRALIEKVKSV